MGMDFRVLVWKRVCKITFFWSEIGSGSEEPGGTPPPRILWSNPPPPPPGYNYIFKYHLRSIQWTVDAWRWIEKPFKWNKYINFSHMVLNWLFFKQTQLNCCPVGNTLDHLSMQTRRFQTSINKCSKRKCTQLILPQMFYSCPSKRNFVC